MSTRCATIVRQVTDFGSHGGLNTDELFRFYRHCDGYPEGHGLDMAQAFVEAERKGTANRDRWISDGLNNRNWAQKCFAELFSSDCDLELEPEGYEHWDLSYLYVVEGRYVAYGGKTNIDSLPVTISIYRRNWSMNDEDSLYDKAMESEPVFSGTPLELIEKYGE